MSERRLHIVNYCHRNCVPFRSITRMPRPYAFDMAVKLAERNPSTTSFYRFADFVNYYPRRIRAEAWLHNWFLDAGGEPTSKHPLYFVLEGSDFLNDWFDNGIVTKIPLDTIDAKHISFTLGDSMSKRELHMIDSPDRRKPLLKDELLELIDQACGVDALIEEVQQQYQWNYIEAQLWNDQYCHKQEG